MELKLNIFKSIGPGDNQLDVLEELADAIVRPLSFYLWQLLIIQGGFWKLRETKGHSHLQEGQEGKYEELHLNPFIGNWATNPQKYFQAHKWQEGNLELLDV